MTARRSAGEAVRKTAAAPRRIRAAVPPPDQAVGSRIRAARKEAGVQLQTLANRTGLSIGYLSQVERGVSSASVRALAQIAEGLGIGLSGLFAPSALGSDAAGFAFPQSERTRIDLPLDGVEKELLTPGAGGLRLFLMTIQTGGHSGEFYSHAGEEAGTVLSGRLELTVEQETRVLTQGDSFRFASDRPHRWRNAGRGLCRVLWVNATGLA